MLRTVSREVLQGFIEEAEGYLPTILKLVNVIQATPNHPEVLEEAHRLVHTIKGAASMVGLAGLSHIAFNVEEALEEIAAGQLPMNDQTAALIRETVAQIKNYLDAVWAGTLDEKSLLTEITVAFRRWHGLPETDDAAVVQQVLEQVAKETSPVSTQEADQKSVASPKTLTPAFETLRYDDSSPELVEAFTTEAEDHLRQIDTSLTELEKQPGDRTLVQNIRRGVHTLKGAAGAVGFRAVSQLAHRLEDLLDQLYEGGMTLTADMLQLLFASLDGLEDLIAGGFDDATMQNRLQDLYARYSAWLDQTPPREPELPQVTIQKAELLPDERALDLAGLTPPSESELTERTAPSAPRSSGQVVRAPIERLDELVRLVSEVAISRTTLEQRMTDFARMVEDLSTSSERLRRVSNNIETQFEASTLGGGRLMPAIAGTLPQLAPTFSEFDALEMDRYTEFHRLRRELTETTTDIRTVGTELAALVGDLESVLVRQGRLSSELQDKLMRVRMVPLATLATRLHRAVRTVARDQGKLVDLVLQGEHIELDKTVLEEMADPLLHLLRNAVDHGIEPPALRQVMGKSERGTIVLKASHEGNQVVIRVSDDGAGLEPQLLRTAAINGGYVSETDAAKITEDELYSFIFMPGFSTAREVSEVSGRGVGLDIVKTNVHKLKGAISVKSESGKGVQFTVRLPMTLAVMRALLVKSNGETVAIPQSSVAQILRVERKEIETIGQEPVIRVGGRVYPVHRLGEVLKLKQPADESLDRVPVLILNTGAEQIALVVDQLLTEREIVIKTLGNHLRRVHGITGATLMGDGTVVLIVNPMDLLNDPAQAEGRTWAPIHIPTRAPVNPHKAWTVMIVDDSVSVRRVVSNLIRRAGWQSVPAKDGLEALEIIQRSSNLPDLILLDIEMPRMDGFELMATLKGQEAYRHIPIAMLTSRAGDKHRRKALELGASEYIVKPYQDDALLNTVRNCILESKKAIPA
ncbi:two-component system, chemotaxis family, sensor histidine kinase and response regulator PixL [Anaerolineae bacterium]|nr:two-component system, chemotaxis family, sensor histidine kinase and response regulator PixL [Anaerolineae bacterium]